MTRDHDLVLFGATGFAGALTARYLAQHAATDVRWALAGRSIDKLERLRERLAELNPACERLPLLRVEVGDAASVRELAERTRVVATTVGPYLRYGEPLVAACAAAGTDYLDLTGEAEFVDLVYLRYDARARESGARLVHSCGFESVPPDLGARFTVEQLPEGVPLRVDGYLRTNAMFSGGTIATALNAMSRPRSMLRTARERSRTEPRPADRRVRAPLGPPRRSPEVRAWALPMPSVDPRIVARSAAALDRYGPDFRYRHYAAVKWLPIAAGGAVGASAMFAAAQIPAVRRFVSARVAPGTGPSEERRARSWFSLRLVGEGGGRRVITEVRGGDPGYDETAKMLAESALSLVSDKLPEVVGQVTTAQAMGEALTDRLTRAGMEFRVLRTSP